MIATAPDARAKPRPLTGRCHLPLPAGTPAAQVSAILDKHGERALAALDAEFSRAVELLAKCARIGPKTAEKIKLRWEAAHGAARGLGGWCGPRAPAMRLLEAEPLPHDGQGAGWRALTPCPTSHAAGGGGGGGSTAGAGVSMAQVLLAPAHPYTTALVNAAPGRSWEGRDGAG